MQPDIYRQPIRYGGFAISPDGSQVATVYMRQADAYLALFDVREGCPTIEIALPCSRPAGLEWSPNGEHVGFWAESTDGSTCDIWVMRVASRELRNLTRDLNRMATMPGWAPDSQQLAFCAFVPPHDPSEPPHVFTAAVSTGEIRQWTSDESPDFTPQFAPKGTTLAFRRVREVGDIWLLDLASEEQRQLTRVGGAKLGRACFAPDSARLVFEHGPTADHRIASVSLRTGAVTELTETSIAASRPSWSPVGDEIAFVESKRSICLITPQGDKVATVALPNRGAVDVVWTASGRDLAILDSGFNVWVAAPGGDARQVIFFPLPPARLHEPMTVAYASADGKSVPAMLFRPRDFLPGCPAVVWVHGGPNLQESPDNPYMQALASGGFVVLAPDYRGSTGHGQEWEDVEADQRGIVDLQDVVAGRDYLAREGLADPDRVGIAGDSYGGYLTLVGLAKHPDQWAAGASLWGIFDVRRLMDFGSEQHDAAWVAQRSPAAMIDRIGAPLLIIHAGRDTTSTIEEVQAAQAELTRRGRVCELKVFPDDTHGLPRHRDECCELLVSFLRRHIGGS